MGFRACQNLEVLDRMVEAGRLRVVIDSRHPLEALGLAWTRSMTGRAAGKIIVDVA
jgi:NADPH:quinone reductase-like Zn-dependent oxidoreductase